MSVAPESVRLARVWVEKAEEDLLVATKLLAIGESCPYSTICFHAQQSVEKYIKAVLVFLQIPFPKVRDIGELLRFVPGTFAVPLTVDEQEKLTFYATTGRYPGDYEPVSRSDAEEMIMAANKVRASIRGQLPPQLSAL